MWRQINFEKSMCVFENIVQNKWNNGIKEGNIDNICQIGLVFNL